MEISISMLTYFVTGFVLLLIKASVIDLFANLFAVAV